ncbi:MAG: molybdopterin-guanine dinucleotide biosynthesis protein B [Desulfurivibrionaceae bacterium]|nr:molybdopterin-guanine dinucleotide biosynthesis protein B [Desulfurivibrionaceae bacterium]
MPPVISFIARPNHGKTTLLEKLLAELGRRGLRVGVIKHHVHDFEFDKKGKDTWRHKQAGAHTVILSSPAGIGMTRDVEYDTPIPELVARYFHDMDLVCTEGYKWEGYPKVEVFRRAIGGEPLAGRNATWAAFVSDARIATDLPCFGLDDIGPLADFLIATYIKKRCVTSTLQGAHGEIALDASEAKYLEDVVLTTLAALRPQEDLRHLTLTICQHDC